MLVAEGSSRLTSIIGTRSSTLLLFFRFSLLTLDTFFSAVGVETGGEIGEELVLEVTTFLGELLGIGAVGEGVAANGFFLVGVALTILDLTGVLLCFPPEMGDVLPEFGGDFEVDFFKGVEPLLGTAGGDSGGSVLGGGGGGGDEERLLVSDMDDCDVDLLSNCDLSD